MAGEGGRPNRFTGELIDFSADEWQSEAKPARDRPSSAQTRETAEAVGFRSREPVKAEKPVTIVPNRRRTGRTDQIGIRTTTETKEAFKSLADAMGWSEAVAFEKAVELMQKQYGAR